MGSGKSTLGKRLASLMSLPFIDLDSEIEKREGRQVSEIFSAEGEEYFRKAESEALRLIIGESGAVVATGGGAPCFANNLEYMNRTGVTVYLKMSPAALASRLASLKEPRPLIAGLSGEKLLRYIEEKLIEREPYYSRATIIFNGLSADVAKLKETIDSIDPGAFKT